ncbi:alpha/beta hydrolase-fold protein [Streptomyces sp. L7]
MTQQYSIDRKRRYTTGQSMGAMMSLGLNIKYPDLFAAAFIVAGQWPRGAGRHRWRRRTCGSWCPPTTPRPTPASRPSPPSSRNRAPRSAPRCGTGSPPPPSSRPTCAA